MEFFYYKVISPNYNADANEQCSKTGSRNQSERTILKTYSNELIT